MGREKPLLTDLQTCNIQNHENQSKTQPNNWWEHLDIMGGDLFTEVNIWISNHLRFVVWVWTWDLTEKSLKIQSNWSCERKIYNQTYVFTRWNYSVLRKRLNTITVLPYHNQLAAVSPILFHCLDPETTCFTLCQNKTLCFLFSMQR